jgi:hypothetical protein
VLASRAAAAALWLTFQVLPPTPSGLGQLLTAVLCYFPAERTMSAIDAASARMLSDGMTSGAVYLSTLRVSAGALARRHPDIEPDRNDARMLRSVLMKPEHEAFVPELHARVERLAR